MSYDELAELLNKNDRKIRKLARELETLKEAHHKAVTAILVKTPGKESISKIGIAKNSHLLAAQLPNRLIRVQQSQNESTETLNPVCK